MSKEANEQELLDAIEVVNTTNRDTPIITTKRCVGCDSLFPISVYNAKITSRCRICQSTNIRKRNADRTKRVRREARGN